VDDEDPIAATRRWLERAVIGLNLCPFAKAVYVKQQVRFVLSAATTAEALLEELAAELALLAATDPDQADAAVAALDLEGEIQIASFHPDYQFARTAFDDVSNCSNRSPYPMLHLLREASVERAVAAFPDPEVIVERNIETLERLGIEGWKKLLG
jgi:hypothetical protein